MFRVKKYVAVISYEMKACLLSFPLKLASGAIRYVKAFTAKRAFTYLICVVITYLRLPFLKLISS